jgi:hypothetical protein
VLLPSDSTKLTSAGTVLLAAESGYLFDAGGQAFRRQPPAFDRQVA